MNYITTSDDTRLYLKDWGAGRPVILMHGWPLSADSWDDQAMALADAGYRAIAYDRRGFGRSSQPWSGYDYDTLSDDLAAVIEQTGAQDAVLVGFSMGGGEVARYMSRHGGKSVSQAVLVSSVVPFMLKTDDNPDGTEQQVFEGMAQGIKADRAAFFAEFFNNFFGVGGPTSSVSPALLEATRQVAMQASLKATLADRRMWGQMRMSPTDLSDVNANTYTYLMNGETSLSNWTGLFRSGEKIRLRFINGSAMTHFDVRIPGLKMTVVAADGQYVHPVTIDEFRIATAETFDVIVEPSGQDAFTIFAQDMGRTGFVAGTLAVREGLRAPIPPVDPRPLLTMQDMGMDHGRMGGMDMSGGKGMEMSCGANMGMAGMDHGAMAQTSKPADADPHAGHDMATMKDGSMAGMDSGSTVTHPASETRNPLVDNQAMVVSSRLDDPGIGLRDNGRKVLSYSMLKSAFDDPDGRDPGRDIELHLTGHMERFAWSFNGQKFSDVEPLRLNYGERMRIVLVNDTMMTHPIHLHGMWSDLEDDQGNFLVRKHTIDMPPGSRRSYRVRADALGSWAYHCHLLYHMEAGMMRTVRVDE